MQRCKKAKAATVVCGMSQKRRLKSANVEKSVKETRRSGVGALITPLSTTHISAQRE